MNAADEPHNWLMYSGTLDSKRFSRLDQIHNRNVAGLELKWAHHIPQLGRAETTPLVVDGVMFITESPSNLVAVDAATGRPFWRYDHELPDDLRICCGRNNRGVAILGETLYMSTLDARMMPSPAAANGAPTPFRDRTIRTTGPGLATRGVRAARPPGSPAPTTPS